MCFPPFLPSKRRSQKQMDVTDVTLPLKRVCLQNKKFKHWEKKKKKLFSLSKKPTFGKRFPSLNKSHLNNGFQHYMCRQHGYSALQWIQALEVWSSSGLLPTSALAGVLCLSSAQRTQTSRLPAPARVLSGVSGFGNAHLMSYACFGLIKNELEKTQKSCLLTKTRLASLVKMQTVP